jgi:hypothetical protein
MRSIWNTVREIRWFAIIAMVCLVLALVAGVLSASVPLVLALVGAGIIAVLLDRQ